jgi:hypothetical protein
MPCHTWRHGNAVQVHETNIHDAKAATQRLEHNVSLFVHVHPHVSSVKAVPVLHVPLPGLAEYAGVEHSAG